MKKKRVGIIGGGIAGSSLAYTLSLYEQIEATVFEKNQIGWATTAKSAGTVCLVDDSLPHEYHDTRVMALNEFIRMDHESPGSSDFKRTGTLAVANDQKSLEYVRRVVDLTRKAGFTADLLDNDSIKKIVPDIVVDSLLGAAYTPEDGYVDGTAISMTYTNKARARGVRILTGTDVTGISKSTGGTLDAQTSRGNFTFDVVVDAAGPWSRRIGEMMGLDLPMWHTKAEVFILQPKSPFSYKIPILKYPNFYTRPEDGKIFACKSHMGLDLSNLKDAGRFDPDALPLTGGTEPYFWDFIVERLAENFPKLAESSVVNDWVGYRSVTKDFLPILGDSPLPGFMLMMGWSGNGIILSPIASKDLARYIVTGEKSNFLEKVSLERFR